MTFVLVLRLRDLGLAVSSLSLLAALAGAADATTGATSTEVVELSPFTVNTSRDLGYVAENTLAGSRLNARLRDTASSVSVFTKEFLEDIAITDIRELMEYTVNGEMDTNSQGASSEQNRIIGGHALTAGVQSRGLIAGLGLDYFSSITPPDPYRVGRFEDARGPNSILFGIGSPGGLLNQTSKVAETHRNSSLIRHGAGSWGRQRLEFDANRVLVKDRLAVSLAAVHQENGGWRAFDFQDKDRIFGSITFRPVRQVTVTAMGETGRDVNAVVRSFSDTEQVLAWYDNRQARGVDAVTFTPGTAAPTAAMQALGVTGRDGTRGGNNRRAVFIENNGVFFDAIGTFLTSSYNNAVVRAPDGTPGVTSSSVPRIYDPKLYPLNGNATGPGMYRDQTLRNYTVTIDWQPRRNLIFNLGQNYQRTNAEVNLMNGNSPILRGDANRTLGIGGPANPYAGRLYFDGNWTRDVHFGETRETRLSVSYQLETKYAWIGRHRLAAAVSRNDVTDKRANSWLVLAGRPYNADPSNTNNRVTVRNYLTEGDYGTYRVGDWRRLPATIAFDGRTFQTAYANVASGGADNGGMMQEIDSRLAAAQSYFLGGRVVTTFGYRKDNVENTQLGYLNDPLRGDVVDPDPAHGIVNRMVGQTRAAGAVFHAFDWLSLIANRSSNVGVPPLARTTFPEGNLAPLSKGRGEDYGVGVDLLEGRLNARAVYFKGSERGRVTAPVANTLRDRNIRVMEALGGALVGSGLPLTAAQWEPIRRAYTPPVNSISNDFDSEGYEVRVTANFTRNWRLVANYSYTDSGRVGLAQEAIDWYGLKQADAVVLVQGVSQNATGQFVVDPSAYATGGAVAKWIELSRLHPGAGLSTLTTSSGITIAQEIFDLVDTLNDEKEAQQKRWGVRPHKISLFTAYDFKQGRLAGFTLGGGWRWRSANVIGANASGAEIVGRVITATDLMLGYTLRPGKLPGRVRFQVNVANVFDRSGIIPSRLATGPTAPDGFMIPGGRGVAYGRFDLIQPREYRFTTTYSF
ncbi:MAG: TonB-dependent receptor plug domain-containing protein [Verrucomicrobia bacterium]|nr:TonB-dependent receptor plug domain-containing protein [Verrucomicrobiota bacterium]